MKPSVPNLSQSLPKITYQHLEELIKHKKRPEILQTEIYRSSYKSQEKIPAQRSLRMTEVQNPLNSSNPQPKTSDFLSQHMDIKSPFYRRISTKHLGKWKCNCHQNKQNSAFPRLRKTHCNVHDEIIAHKNYLVKKFHDSIVTDIKQSHAKYHEAIEKNRYEYLSYTLQNQAKIKEEKALLAEKNKEEQIYRLAKTKMQAQLEKEFNMLLLKQRLDEMYKIDNENQQFQKVLLLRNRWETKRNLWKDKILSSIKKKINRARDIQAKIAKRAEFLANTEGSMKFTEKFLDGSIAHLSQSKIKNSEKQNEKMLQDIESCLGVLMKNVGSVSDLVPKYQSNQTKSRISEIFKKNLGCETPSYVKKLRKMVGDIVEEIVLEQTEVKFGKTKKSINNRITCQQLIQNEAEEIQENYLKSFKSQAKTKKNLMSVKSVKSLNNSIHNLGNQGNDAKERQSLEEKKALQMKAEQNLLNASLVSSSYLTPINQEHGNIEETAQEILMNNKKFSILSGKSSVSNRNHSHSRLSKVSFMSNSFKRGSALSSHRKNTFGADEQVKESPSGSVENSQRNNSVQQSEEQTPTIHFGFNNKTSSHHSGHFQAMPPSLSKSVICEKQELQMESEDETMEERLREQQLRTARALKYFKSARQQEQEIQKNRIDGMVNLMKQKIQNKKEFINLNPIPDTYLQIKYDEFCNQKTFKYIASMVDGFEGVKRFKFIYSQLRAKKKILNDSYAQNLMKEFQPMIGQDLQEQWKQFLIECRTKIMNDNLNHLIDQGIQVMEPAVQEIQELPKEIEQKANEEEVPKECEIFQKIDESQIAFERYIQRLARKNQKEAEPKRMAFANIKLPNIIPEEQQESPQVSQKTIQSDIETNSTKNIRYNIIDHDEINKKQKKYQFETEDPSLASLKNAQYKKKVLGYLLKKNPVQFQQLNKNFNEMSKIFNNSIDQMRSKSVERTPKGSLKSELIRG